MITACLRLRVALCLTLSLAACAPPEVPTPLTAPAGATDLRSLPLEGGRAFQTDFILRAEYPANPALVHYTALLTSPWQPCDWSSARWQRFVDTSAGAPRVVHQRIDMWVNPAAGRSFTLAVRYYTAGDAASEPANNVQWVVAVETMKVKVEEITQQLSLSCGAVK